MRTLAAIIIFVLVYAAGAITHESDIERQCREQGQSGKAGWFIDIKCSPNKPGDVKP